jgi:hypothetical protein
VNDKQIVELAKSEMPQDCGGMLLDFKKKKKNAVFQQKKSCLTGKKSGFIKHGKKMGRTLPPCKKTDDIRGCHQ